MGNPEEISNIEHFPISPRVSRELKGSESIEGNPVPSAEKGTTKRSLTPSHRGQVEFWHQGEQPDVNIPNMRPKSGKTHAKRADQLGLILGILTVLMVALTFVGLHFANKKFNFQNSVRPKTSTPVIDFYSGENAFSKKFHDEKEAKIGVLGSDTLVGSGVGDGIEVSLKEQMDSMQEKMEKIRAQRLIDEASLPTPAPTPQSPAKLLGVRPTELKKFDNPLDFNGMLPKSLQQTNQTSQ